MSRGHDQQTCEFCQACRAHGAELPPDPADQLAARIVELIKPLLAEMTGQRQKLLTITEASEQLGVSKHVVYDLMYKGELKSVEIPPYNGTRAIRRFEQAEIDAFIERHRTGPVETPGAFPVRRP